MAKKKMGPDDLEAALFAAKDGGAACDAINALAKQANKGDGRAKQVLAKYVRTGSIHHMRKHACAGLAHSAKNTDDELAELFRWGLTDPDTRYWSIEGLINTFGKGAYAELIRVAEDEAVPLEGRSHAVKCLAVFSKQPFDRKLPVDPGFWKESDLRLSEIRNWAKAGFPDGQGFSPPTRHSAIDHPTTPFERIVSRFDKKLAKKRRKLQDLAEPTDWLAIPLANDIERITTRWSLPSVYRDFLTRFSPIRVTIESREFYNHFQLFGAAELIEAQDGYSYNSVERRPLEDWPSHLLVIASHGGDPFVLDLSKSDGNDAPVDTAEHGIGVWDFGRVADSFSSLLEMLSK